MTSPRRPVQVGDWVSSAAYGFSAGRVVMDLGEGPDLGEAMARVRLDRSEATVKSRLIRPASEDEIAAAEQRLAHIEKERTAPYP